MERTRVLEIAELIHGGRPLTATYSLVSKLRSRSVSTDSSHSAQRSKPYARRDHNPNPNPNPSPSSSPSPGVITPLDFPAIIVGIVTLPAVWRGNSSSNSTFRCSYDSCLQFSDGSAAICCDILDLDLWMIGKKIRVLAWNFIPIKRGGGFLEIIRWSFCDAESVSPWCFDEALFSLSPSSSGVSDSISKSRHRLHGALELISPISLNPCSSGASNLQNTANSNPTTTTSLRGFLVRILVCECRSCTSRESIQEQNSHSFTKPVIVYFCGSASCWHSVITKLIGNVVTISGLKKKLVCLGGEESSLVYVTAENSRLRYFRLQKKFVPISKTYVKGKGECGSYTGIVKEIYMQGMIVELDNEVWLLLTNQLLTAPHSLRVGALISVRNVHFVNPNFSWTKMLILGACYKSSITVECFSPLMAGCHILSQSRSMLGNFIESLAFSARLWVLLLVTCFRKKFAYMLSEKEMIGTNKKEGLVQFYSNSRLPPSMLRSSTNRHGVFMSLFKHESCGFEGHNANLKLVVPLCTFTHHCHAKWMKTVELENEKISCDGKSYGQPIRRVFSSEDVGIVLIGSLKISHSSGKLQLVDATGMIDVIVPDLPSSWNPIASNIYEVVDYSLVIEGTPRLIDYLEPIDKPFSCRSIFNFIPPASEVNSTVYAYFHLQNAGCRNFSFYPRVELGEDLERLKNGIYHLLYLNHKFPMVEKLQDDTVISKTSSMFAEAVILHWNLILAGNDGFVIAAKDSGDQLKKHMEHCNGRNHQENISKRHKTDHVSHIALSNLVEIPCKAVQQLRPSSHFDAGSIEKQSCRNFSSHEISCSATIKVSKNHSVVRSVSLCYTGANLNGCGIFRPSAQKALLEFKPDSFYMYQLSQIGCYYITEHDEKDSFCTNTDLDSVGGVNILVTSELRLWSLSFTPEDVLPSSNLSNGPPLGNSHPHSDESSHMDCNELCLHMPNGDNLETSSDVSLSMTANRTSIVKVNMSELQECMVKSVTPKGSAEFSPCPKTMFSVPPLLPNNSCLLPEGNLVSFRGHVVAAHNVGDHVNSQNLGDSLKSRLFSEAISSCIHVLVDHQIVKVVSSLSKLVLPPGFGPGVDATFYRVLELGGQNRWMLTPVSFIVINSISVVNQPCSENCSSLVLEMNDGATLETFASGLISELVHHPDCKLMQIRCRVVSVHILVFEKCRKGPHLPLKFDSTQQQVDIPIAGFLLDDGSSECCCWANAERAATFLRLHEKLPEKRAFGSHDWKFNTVNHNSCQTINYHLWRILKKHDRIVVKKFGPLYDSSYQDLAISVSSDKALSLSDENFLKSVVFNACVGTSWTIVASLMDSGTIGHIEKQQNILRTEMITSSMKNIWAKEVHHTNPFTEARAIIQELLDRSTLYLWPYQNFQCNEFVYILRRNISNFHRVQKWVILGVAEMSLPVNQQAPPATVVMQQSYGYHVSHHGSVGPVVAVMVVIMILGAMAVVVGRLCSGKRIMGYGQYDLESWAERKCSSCIDGSVNVPLPRVNGSAAPVAVSAPPPPVQSH